MEISKYLKKVGVASQREIEHATLKAIDSAKLNGHERLNVTMILTIPAIILKHKITGEIALE